MTDGDAPGRPERPGAPDVAVLVVSCDKYSDLWEPFFTFLTRYWPDCTYPVFLLANFGDWSRDGVSTVRIGQDVSWSDSLRLAVQSLGVPYVLTIQEDFLLEAPVSTQALARAVCELHKRGGAYLRLVPTAAPWWRRAGRPRPIVVSIRAHTPYRISNQASVWSSAALLGLLRPGESPWQMEVEGSERSSEDMGAYFSSTTPLLRYHPHGAVIRGKWSRRAAQRCREAGVWRPRRPVQSVVETWRQAAVDTVFTIVMALAPNLLWRVTLAHYRGGIPCTGQSTGASTHRTADRSAGTGG